jgi:Kef-type K+ transport system membrane component KefB
MSRQQQAEENSFQSFRWIDNLHILFWLIKDMSWAMLLRPVGVLMIAPTLGVAIYILWKSRHHRTELFHNIAVCLWIAANSLWMIGEFYGMELRPYAVVLFSIGLTILTVYYVFYFRKDRSKSREAQAITIK